MKLFNTIAIEISSLCNRKCKFCPNCYFKRPDEYMSFNTIKHILNNLKSLHYSGRIEFYIYNEPMRDKRLYEILQLFREELPKAILMIATNGDYINSIKDIKHLFLSGLNQLQINVYSNIDRFNFLKKYVDYYKEINQEKSIYLKCSPKNKICKVINKTNIDKFKGFHALTNRSGLIAPFINPTDKSLKRMCVKPFRMLNINWKGNAIICCNDYFGKVSSGNVMNFTLEELWNKDLFNKYRKYLLNKDRTLFLCDKCDTPTGAYSHNVPKID